MLKFTVYDVFPRFRNSIPRGRSIQPRSARLQEHDGNPRLCGSFVCNLLRETEQSRGGYHGNFDGGRLRCCKCGSDQGVSLRAYLLTYSLVFFTSKSAGAFKPICGSCSIKAGLPYCLGTLLLGWWGIPWGPIYTVQAIAKNLRGGVVLSSQDHAKV